MSRSSFATEGFRWSKPPCILVVSCNTIISITISLLTTFLCSSIALNGKLQGKDNYLPLLVRVKESIKKGVNSKDGSQSL